MSARKYLNIVFSDGGSLGIRDPDADDPDLWYQTAIDLARRVRSIEPNRNLGATDRLLGAGEWEVAVQFILGAIQNDPEPIDPVIQALKDRVDRLKPHTRLWGYSK